MRSRILIPLSGTLALLTPSLTLAATTPQTFSDLVLLLIRYINILIPIVLALGVLAYMKNTATGIFKLQSGKADPTWQKGMGWGILGLFMMISLWGILSILTHTFF